MEWFEALLLGLLQGLTEFLPVSSSGHLIIAKELLGIGVQPGAETTFEVVVHTATVLSTIFVFRRDLSALVRGVFKFENNSETHYILKILISLIPVMIVGLLFKDQVEMFFGSGILLVGFMLLLTAVLLTFTHYFHSGQRSINYRDAFVIGIAQAIAVLPGLSRSGATISTGLLLGNRKEEVARFSFLMVLIPVLGEAFLMLLKGEFSPGASGISKISLIVGFLAAFLSGVLACKLMIELVKRSKLLFFAIYCFIIALSVIFFTL